MTEGMLRKLVVDAAGSLKSTVRLESEAISPVTNCH